MPWRSRSRGRIRLESGGHGPDPHEGSRPEPCIAANGARRRLTSAIESRPERTEERAPVQAGPWRRGLEAAWAPALLALAVVLFFGDSLFAGQAPYLRDTLCDFLPYRALQKRALWSGSLPLWNHLSGCGQPFLGDPHCSPLYPPLLLFHLLPLVPALKWSLALHAYSLALGTYLLARRWRCERLPASIAGVTCTFGTFSVAWMEFHISFAALAWVPWVLLAASATAERVSTAPTRGWRRWVLDPRPAGGSIALLALVVATQYLAGNAEYFAFSSLLVLSYAGVYFTALHGWPAALRTMQALLLGFVLAGMLSAPDLLLLLQHIPLSVRSVDFDPRLDQASLHPMHWLTLVLPFLFGKAGYFDKYFARTVYEFWAGACYVGILPLLSVVAALTLGWRRDPAQRGMRALQAILAANLLFGVLASSGRYTFVFGLLHEFVPGFTHMRWPGKCLFFVHFTLAFLSALGMQALVDRARALRCRSGRSLADWVAPGVAGAIGIALSFALVLLTRDGSHAFRTLTCHQGFPTPERVAALAGAVRFALGVSLLSIIAFVALHARRVPPWIPQSAALGITLLDVLVVGRQVHPIGPDGIYRYDDAVARHATGERSDGKRIHSNFASIQQFLYGDPDPEAYETAKEVAAGSTWIALGESCDWSSGIVRERYSAMYGLYDLEASDATANRVADLTAVTHLIAPSPRPDGWNGEDFHSARVFQRATALPRALLVGSWECSPDLASSLHRVLDLSFEPLRMAVLEADEAANSPPPAEANDAPVDGGVTSIQYGFDRVTLRVRSSRRALLVLNDTWYPGWKARIDGVRAPIYRANVLFRGVFLGPGEHEVLFEYAPWQFRFGGLLGLGALLLVVGVFVRDALARTRRTQRGPITAPG